MKIIKFGSTIFGKIEPAFAPEFGSRPRQPKEEVRPNWIPIRPHRTDAISSNDLATLTECQTGAEPLCGQGTVPTFVNALALMRVEGEANLAPKFTDLYLGWESVRDRHVLAIGRTGAGKTSKVILPMLYSDLQNSARSIIVVDAKGDLTAPVIEMTKQVRGKSAKIQYISFSEPELSLGFNPIANITTRSEAREIAIALSLSEPPGDNETPFFRMQATKLLTALIVALQKHPSRCNLKFLNQFLNMSPTEMAKAAKALGMDTESGPIHLVLMDNKNCETVLMEATNYVPFDDEDVMATTSTAEFQFEQLLAEPTVLIIRMPEGVRRLGGLHSLMILRLFAWVVSSADREPTKRLARPVSCFIDEFATVGRLPEVERALATFRSRGFSFVAAIQSMSQLAGVYGEARAQTIANSFSTLILIPPVAEADAHTGTVRSGTMTVCQLETAGIHNEFIVRESIGPRPVLTTSELMAPPCHPERGPLITLFVADRHPVLAYLLPIWKYPAFTGMDRSKGGGPNGKVPRRTRQLGSPKADSSFDVKSSDGFTNSSKLGNRALSQKIDSTKAELGWGSCSYGAKTWFTGFETQNAERLPAVLRLLEELKQRGATIMEFMRACQLSSTANILANLSFLDYLRRKEADEERRMIESYEDD